MMVRVLVLLVLVALSFGAAAETLDGRVVRVIDGDTVVLLAPGNVEERVRLSGIDCPERGQAFGTKAKEVLSGRVAGETVSVEWELLLDSWAGETSENQRVGDFKFSPHESF